MYSRTASTPKQLIAYATRRISSTLRVGPDVVHAVDRPPIWFPAACPISRTRAHLRPYSTGYR